MLVLGGGAKSVGLYAAAWPSATAPASSTTSTAARVRRRIAESFARAESRDGGSQAKGGGEVRRRRRGTSRAAGLRDALGLLAPGGVCTAVGYYLAPGRARR